MKLRKIDVHSVYVLAHVLASTMPDVLDKERREQWLEFAVGGSVSLILDIENDNYNLKAASKCEIRLHDWEGELVGLTSVYLPINLYEPGLAPVIGGKAITLVFSDVEVCVEYHDNMPFSILYEDLPWVLIHALQAAPKGIRA